MSADAWTDEEAAVQRECWSHGFLLTYEDLVAEVERRREVANVEAPWAEVTFR